ncbi:MAG: hypothetical protein MJ025_04850 [Victivallaceae bacterium]|nr:hypothetical protein [Victivallaceae bacterium]
MISSRFVLAALCSAMLLAGCTVIRELPSDFRIPEQNNDEYVLAAKILDSMLRGDYDLFRKSVPDNISSKFTKETFEESRKRVTDQLGTPVSYRYLTKLEMPTFSPFVWAVRFERYDLKMENTFHSEVLFRVITAKLDGKPVVTSFNFL